MNRRTGCFFIFSLVFILIFNVCTAAEITLPEKVRRQLEGSDLKGSFLITIDGESETSRLLEPLHHVRFNIRGVSDYRDRHYYIYQQAEKDAPMLGKSELYIKDGQYYFRSDMLADRVFVLSPPSDYLDRTLSIQRENPTLTAFLLNLLFTDGLSSLQNNKSVLAPYFEMTEEWLSGFDMETNLINSGMNESMVEMNYVIPMEAVKEYMVSLLHRLLSDRAVTDQTGSYMSDEQQALYMNPNLEYYYDEAIRSMFQESDVLLSRVVTTKGVFVSSSVLLPLDSQYTGYSELLIEESPDRSVYTLKNDERTVSVVIKGGLDLKAQDLESSLWLVTRPGPKADPARKDYRCIRLDIRKKVSFSFDDEEGRNHETHEFTLHAENDSSVLNDSDDPARYQSIQPADFSLNLHYSSKTLDSSPTTVAVDLKYHHADFGISVNGEFKTATPSRFSPFELSGPFVDLSADRPESIAQYLLEWLNQSSDILVKEIPSEGQDTPEETNGNTGGA